jgi:Ca2+-transporting ATPase
MAVSGLHATDSRQLYYIKGAIEAILPRCKSYYISDDSMPPLDGLTRSLIASKAESVASRGLRVVAMAYGFGTVKSLEADSEPLIDGRASSPHPQANLIFTGFQAMMDPPRKGVSNAVAELRSGGVRVVMITGDALETAMAIGEHLGLLVPTSPFSRIKAPNGDHSGEKNSTIMTGCMTGKELDSMDDRMLRERVASISIFARTSPKHKMRIVGALQSRGAVVGMTGDGGTIRSESSPIEQCFRRLFVVNDAPALKMADIGVVMGSGTDVAKEAADVILVDDNFSTILSAVKEGTSSGGWLCPATVS